MNIENNNRPKTAETELLVGRNAVSEALRKGRVIDTLLVARGERGGSIVRIIAECREKGVVVKEVDKRKLDYLCAQGNHQGVAAYVAAHEYAEIDDIFALAEERGEEPFIIICDELEDPHNLGAVIQNCGVCRRSRNNYSEKAQCFAHMGSFKSGSRRA